MAFLGQGDGLKGLGRIEEAIASYTKVIEVDPQSISQSLMKRGLLYLELRKNELALRDFNKLTHIAEEQHAMLQKDKNNSQDCQVTSLSKAYFYKAKALKKMNNM